MTQDRSLLKHLAVKWLDCTALDVFLSISQVWHAFSVMTGQILPSYIQHFASLPALRGLGMFSTAPGLGIKLL